jgi:hypothetical protein
MRFITAVDQDIAGGHPPPSAVPRLVIASSYDQGCISTIMAMARDSHRFAASFQAQPNPFGSHLTLP